jgi:hypothetical protein
MSLISLTPSHMGMGMVDSLCCGCGKAHLVDGGFGIYFGKGVFLKGQQVCYYYVGV